MSKPRQPEAVITTPRPYNPLDTENLGRSVAEALLGRKPTGLQDLPSFEGAGLYALYYQGGHPVYDRLAAPNRSADPQAPIYVGKAVPEGARKGGVGTRKASNTALFKRLTEHAESIRVTRDLNLADFSCRFLVVEDIWIPLGESLLIAKFSPVWNQIVEGFGNHDPGSGRAGTCCTQGGPGPRSASLARKLPSKSAVRSAPTCGPSCRSASRTTL